jgi:hypothetical protein
VIASGGPGDARAVEHSEQPTRLRVGVNDLAKRKARDKTSKTS